MSSKAKGDAPTTALRVGQGPAPRICKVTGVVRIDERRFTIHAQGYQLDAFEMVALAAAIEEYAVSHGYTCGRDGSALFDLFAEPDTLLPQDKGDIRVALHVITERAMRTIAEHTTSSLQFNTTDKDVEVAA